MPLYVNLSILSITRLESRNVNKQARYNPFLTQSFTTNVCGIGHGIMVKEFDIIFVKCTQKY